MAMLRSVAFVVLWACGNVSSVGMDAETPGVLLEVTKSGVGTVTASVGGIDCGAVCSASYAPNTTVTLTARAGLYHTFTMFSGGECSGSGDCTLTMDAAKTISATFTPTCTSNTECANKKCVNGGCARYAYLAAGSLGGDQGISGFTSSCGVSLTNFLTQAQAEIMRIDPVPLPWAAISSANDPETVFGKGDGPYILMDADDKMSVPNFSNNVIVADNWTDLVDGTLKSQINVDPELQTLPGFTRVWTGTNQDGMSSGTDCADWASTTASGTYGTVGALDTMWTAASTAACNNLYSIYCFEQ